MHPTFVHKKIIDVWAHLCWFFLPCCIPESAFSQVPPQKQITQQYQFWTSLNATLRMSKHWGALADGHIRRNNFLADPGFYLIRGAGNFWITEGMTVALGYAHVWSAHPDPSGGFFFSNENRIYQQFQDGLKKTRVAISQRVRNEQRWQQKVEGGKITGQLRFTDRIRYLFSFTYDVFQKPNLPSPVVSDEILFHFGKDVVYNIFDQNRLFVGIKQSISSRLNFDFRYMMVFLQKYSGYQYDLNHTLRLFFYLNIGKRRSAQQATMEKVMDED